MCNWNCFLYFSTKTCAVGIQKNYLNEMVLFSTQNTCSNWWISKLWQFYAEKICLTGPMHTAVISNKSLCAGPNIKLQWLTWHNDCFITRPWPCVLAWWAFFVLRTSKRHFHTFTISSSFNWYLFKNPRIHEWKFIVFKILNFRISKNLQNALIQILKN